MDRLLARRPEIEEAVCARIGDIPTGTAADHDTGYATGLRAAVSAAVAYCLDGLEGPTGSEVSIPANLAEQARRAARLNVSLDVVLLRCVAGHTCFGAFVIEEGQYVPAWAMREVHEAHGAVLERLMAAVVAEHGAERARMSRSPVQHRFERVQRLLAGQPVQAVDLAYDLDAWHLGLIAKGSGVRAFIQRAARDLDCQALTLYPDEGTGWAWLPAQRRHPMHEVQKQLLSGPAMEVLVAIGEPAQGKRGFRLTHQQAQEALLVASTYASPLTRYADVLLLAAALRNDVFARSLCDMFLSPLDDIPSRRDGKILRETLRAYLAAGHNVKAAAAALGIDRGTARKRLATAEERIGRLLTACQGELDIALRLDELQERSRVAEAAQGPE